ncbi:hypothetical protein SJ05684_c22950 [Sinorhizobium sojae CCBAU 05684]|uniref:Uncharacterized protein n=1 Tax=Sinorhizobium sojae CCBAU 05684 TaxID=716928 RepID=A0A249PD29_9HYPH|nr:hypothetical protein SJ05684_c22950 [Sinorhizobium sojae CCBAU 05684]
MTMFHEVMKADDAGRNDERQARTALRPVELSASARKSYPVFGKLDAQIQRVQRTFARLKRRAAL